MSYTINNSLPDKPGTVGVEFSELWFDLYASLTHQERIVFQSLLRSKYFIEPCTIIKQQFINNRLFFINQGSATLTKYKCGSLITTQHLQKGMVAGHDSFFGNSPSRETVEVSAATQIDYIDKQALSGVAEEHPELEKKISDFCLTIARHNCGNESPESCDSETYSINSQTLPTVVRLSRNTHRKKIFGRLLPRLLLKKET